MTAWSARIRATVTGAEGTIERRVARGAVWLLAGSIGAGLLQLAMGFVAARLLGIESYGALMLVFGTMYTVAITIGTIIGVIATRDVAAALASQSREAGAILGRGITVALVAGTTVTLAVLAGAGPLAAALGPSPLLVPLVRLGALFVLPSMLLLVLQALLSGFEAFGAVAISRVVNWVGNLAGVVAFATTSGAAGAMAGMAGAALLTAGLSGWSVHRAARRRGITPVLTARLDLAEVREYLPMTVSNVIGFPAVWWANVLVAHGAHGLAAVAIVNSAASWRALLQLVPTVFTSSLLPALAGSLPGNSTGEVRRAVGRAVLLAGAIAAATLGVLSVAAPTIMRSYGPAFAPHGDVLVTLAFATALGGTASVVGPVFVAYRRQWWSTALNVATLGILVGLVALWQDDGAAGFARANLVAYVLHLFGALVLGERVLRHRPGPA